MQGKGGLGAPCSVKLKSIGTLVRDEKHASAKDADRGFKR